MEPRLATSESPCYAIGMKKYRFPVVVERDEDGLLVGTVPALKGCHTQARTIAELDKRLKEAVKVCLEAGERPLKQNDFVGVHQIEVSA
jgi:predicted RNase H-like HicB family nuclease